MAFKKYFLKSQIGFPDGVWNYFFDTEEEQIINVFNLITDEQYRNKSNSYKIKSINEK